MESVNTHYYTDVCNADRYGVLLMGISIYFRGGIIIKLKKMLSVVAAAAISASAFAGMILTANASDTDAVTYIWDLTASSGAVQKGKITSDQNEDVIIMSTGVELSKRSDFTYASGDDTTTKHCVAQMNATKDESLKITVPEGYTSASLYFELGCASNKTIYIKELSSDEVIITDKTNGNDNKKKLRVYTAKVESGKTYYVDYNMLNNDGSKNYYACIGKVALTLTKDSGETPSSSPTATAEPEKTSSDILIQGNARVKSLTLTPQDNNSTPYTVTWQRNGSSSVNGKEYQTLKDVPFGTYDVSATYVTEYYKAKSCPSTITIDANTTYNETTPNLVVTTDKITGVPNELDTDKLYGKTITFDFSTNTGAPNEYLNLESSETTRVLSNDLDEGIFLKVDTTTNKNDSTALDGVVANGKLGGKFNSIAVGGNSIQCNPGTEYTYTGESGFVGFVAWNKTWLSKIEVTSVAKPVAPSATAAVSQDFTDSTGVAASLWNAKLEGNGTTFNNVKATVTASDGKTASAEAKLDTNITSDGNVEIFVVVNKASSDITTVEITTSTVE